MWAAIVGFFTVVGQLIEVFMWYVKKKEATDAAHQKEINSVAVQAHQAITNRDASMLNTAVVRMRNL